uniref:GAT domain-containing protein n=1 Tax=Trichuris muris TaxID=70415 RepID=A0A5S6QGX5_TRIMR
MDSEFDDCELSYNNILEHIERTIRLDLLTVNPSEAAKGLVRLMCKIAKSDLMENVVMTTSNPVTAATLLQTVEKAMSNTSKQNVTEKLAKFFEKTDETAELAQQLIRSNEEVTKIISVYEKESCESNDKTTANATFDLESATTIVSKGDEGRRSSNAEHYYD